MKLKEFNTDNVHHERKGVPCMGVSCKSGLFNFNRDCVQLIGMKEADQVILLQDEDEKENWYLEVVKEKGFPLRVKANITTGLLFNSVELARLLIGGENGESQRFLIAGKPTIEKKRIFWGLIRKPV